MNPKTHITRLPHTIAIASLTGGLAVCYGLWTASGCDPFIPFISDMDLHPWTSHLFTTALTTSGLAFAAFALQLTLLRHRFIAQLKRATLLLKVWNIASALPGVLAGVSLVVVAWVPWNQDVQTHFEYAHYAFFAGILWAFATTIVTWEAGKSHRPTRAHLKPRLFFLVTAAIALYAMLSRMDDALKTHFSFEEAIISSKQFDIFCQGNAQYLDHPILNQAAIAEWILASAMVLFIGTFASELAHLSDRSPIT